MTTSVSNFLDDASNVSAGKIRREVTFATFQRRVSHQACHGSLAIRAVRLVLNLAIRQPTKQDAAMLRVFVRNRFLFKCFAKTLNFLFQVLILCFKPIVFLFETLELFPELDNSFLEDCRTPVLGDDLIESCEQVSDGVHVFS